MARKKQIDANRKVVLYLLGLLLFVQLLGLYLGSKLIRVMPQSQVASGAEFGVFIFAYILFATGVMLLIIKYWKNVLRGMELFSVLFSTFIFFSVFLFELVPAGLEDVLGVLLALIVTASRVFWKTFLTQNVAMLLSIIGVGAMIGASLGFLPALILLGLLTIYDVIAVFKTKHMVTMAKEIIKQKLAFTMAIPTKNHTFQLGGGDLAMPLVFSVAVLREFGMATALATVGGSMLFLVIFFAWLSKKPGKAYPALPPVTLGAIAGWAIAVLIGVFL